MYVHVHTFAKTRFPYQFLDMYVVQLCSTNAYVTVIVFGYCNYMYNVLFAKNLIWKVIKRFGWPVL